MLPFCFMGKHDVHTMYSPPNRVSHLQDLSFKKRKKTHTFLALLAKSDLFVKGTSKLHSCGCHGFHDHLVSQNQMFGCYCSNAYKIEMILAFVCLVLLLVEVVLYF